MASEIEVPEIRSSLLTEWPEIGLETPPSLVEREMASLAKRATSSDDLAPGEVLSCAAKAQVTCDRSIWPRGSNAGNCVDVLNVRLWTSGHDKLVKCYCENKQVQKPWWDCFYEAAAKCPDQRITMDKVWYQEWVYHRVSRRRNCLDDFKPHPPWDKINDYMKTQYNRSAELQYARDW
ncbi:hypothetical protein HBH76_076550 [Parastagonospora nodorum]|nr:hypothetical protein HBH76_076550 [Parastagonospora nodorum]